MICKCFFFLFRSYNFCGRLVVYVVTLFAPFSTTMVDVDNSLKHIDRMFGIVWARYLRMYSSTHKISVKGFAKNWPSVTSWVSSHVNPPRPGGRHLRVQFSAQMRTYSSICCLYINTDFKDYRQTSGIRHQIRTQAVPISSCSCLYPIHWSKVLSRE